MQSSPLQDAQHSFRERLVAALTADRAALAHAWCAAIGSGPAAVTAAQAAQAEDFLALLSRGLADPAAGRRLTPAHDAALQREYPLVYRISGMLRLAGLLADRLAADSTDTVPLAALADFVQEGLAAVCPLTAHDSPLTDLLGRLSLFSVELARLQDQDTIITRALTEAPRLVGAAACTLWSWDADQRAPLLQVTLDGAVMPETLPGPLLELFREACESHCAFNIDPGESAEEHGWPAALVNRAIAFVPLPAEPSCLGVLTVEAADGQTFTHDDILLLSSLGNLISTALQNARLHHHAHQLVSLLQSSITRLVQATSGARLQRDDFLHSLLQIAEGLTRANAVGAVLTLDDPVDVLESVTGRHLPLDQITRLAHTLLAWDGMHPLPQTGTLDALTGLPALDPAVLAQTYTLVPIHLGDRQAGLLCALSSGALSEDQIAFLHSIAGVVGVGIANLRQARSNESLLVQLSNLIDFTTTISARELVIQDDSVARQIMTLTAQRLASAADMPICLCGWVDQDSAIRIWPGSTVGLPPPLEAQLVAQAMDYDAQLPLTINNRILRGVLSRREPIAREQDAAGRPAFRWLQALGVQDWVCLPMVVQSHARGIVILADTRPHPLSLREAALVATYANQAALSLEHALLNEERQRKLAQTEQLYRFASSLSATLAIGDILDKVMHAACDILRAPVALVTLSVEDSTLQCGRTAVGLAQPLPGNLTFPDHGIVGTVARRRKPVDSVDLRSDGRDPVLRALAMEAGLTSALTAPVMAHTHSPLLGTLTIFTDTLREFTQDEQQMLQTLATQAALAIQNAQALVLETQRTRDLHLLLDRLTRHLPALLELVLDVLEATRREGTPDGVTRARLRLESLLTVQQEIGDETLAAINVKAAVTRLCHDRTLRATDGLPAPRLNVHGAAIHLPWRQATLLALLVHEWLLAAEAMAPPAGLRANLTFQQAGEGILVQFDDNADYGDASAPVSAAVIDLVEQALHGTMSETRETPGHRMRYRFRLGDEPHRQLPRKTP